MTYASIRTASLLAVAGAVLLTGPVLESASANFGQQELRASMKAKFDGDPNPTKVRNEDLTLTFDGNDLTYTATDGDTTWSGTMQTSKRLTEGKARITGTGSAVERDDDDNVVRTTGDLTARGHYMVKTNRKGDSKTRLKVKAKSGSDKFMVRATGRSKA
jgi:hypothetical protein